MYEKEIRKFDILLEKADIVSFDIFDTLLIRPYLFPEDLFEHMEEFYRLDGFKKERILAEKRARYRNMKDEDITIDDIYNSICPEYLYMKKVEMDFETQVLRPNPYVKYFYEKAVNTAKRIIAISDMYLPENFLLEVLNKNGFIEIEKVFVSNKYKKCKGSKHLYNEVTRELTISPNKILHLGDNLQSDYFKAIESGYRALYLENFVVKFLKTRSGKKYLSLYNNNKKLANSVIINLLAAQYLENLPNYWYYLGYSIGGIFAAGYIQFIIKQIKQNNINNLLFISRDGYLLQKVYKIFAGNKVIENHYIYAPRILNLKCFLDYRKKFVYLRNIFEMNKDICPEFCNIPKSFDKAERLFNDNINILKNRADENLREYQEYLTQQNIKNERIAVVDMTTGAFSSQALLTSIYKDKVKLGIFSGTFSNDTEFIYKIFVNKKFTPLDVPKVNILELLFTAPELPLETIKNSKPVYKTKTSSDLFRLSIYKDIEQGILDFINMYKGVFGKFQINIEGETAFNLIDIVAEHCNGINKYNLKRVKHSSDVSNKNFNSIYSDLEFQKIFHIKLLNFKRNLKRKIRTYLRDKYRLIKFYFYEFKMLDK